MAIKIFTVMIKERTKTQEAMMLGWKSPSGMKAVFLFGILISHIGGGAIVKIKTK